MKSTASATFRPASARLDRTIVLAILVICALVATAILTADPAEPAGSALPTASRNVAGLMIDDAFYYQRIADNLAAGTGSSFDGVHPTNGYHPLWMLLLVPINWLTGGREHALVATFATQVVFLAGTATALFVTVRSAFSPLSSAAAVLLWLVLQTGYWPSLSGMEYALQALVIALLMLAATRFDAEGAASGFWRAFGWSVLLSLAFLARLDNLLLGAALLAAAAFASVRASGLESRRRSRRRAALGSLALGVTAGLYFAANKLFFGTLMPASGLLKREWSQARLETDPVRLQAGLVVAKLRSLAWPFENWPGTEAGLFVLGTAGVTVALLGSALLASRRSARPLLPPPLRSALVPFAAFSVVQAALYSLLFHGGLQAQPWYYPVQGLLAAVLVGALVEAFVGWPKLSSSESRRRWALGLVTVFLVVLLGRSYRSTERLRNRLADFPRSPLYSAALWVESNVHPPSVVGAWNAGTISQFSRVDVVNLDGLVNDSQFLVGGRHDLCAYWRAEGVTHLVDVFDSLDPFHQFAAEASGCLDDLERIWEGPGYPGSSWRAAAYRISGSGAGRR